MREPKALVRLEPLGRKHANKMLLWMKDPEVAANIGLRQEPSLEKTTVWLEKAALDDSIRASSILLDDHHVGNVVIDQIDRYLSTGRLSVYIGEPEFRGRGIARAAVCMALQLGFDGEALNKIWLTVHTLNFKAISLYTSLGFALEGVLQDEFLLHGRRLPVFRMALFKRDFAAAAREQAK